MIYICAHWIYKPVKTDGVKAGFICTVSFYLWIPLAEHMYATFVYTCLLIKLFCKKKKKKSAKAGVIMVRQPSTIYNLIYTFLILGVHIINLLFVFYRTILALTYSAIAAGWHSG